MLWMMPERQPQLADALELEEGGEFPAQSHEEDIEVPEGGFVRHIIVPDQTAAGQRLIRTTGRAACKATASFMLIQ